MERVGHIVDTSVNEGAKLVAGKSKIAATSMQQYNISLFGIGLKINIGIYNYTL